MQQKDASKGLTPRQIRVAAALADPENQEMTQREFAARMHMSLSTLEKWRRQDAFLEETRAFARKAARAHLAAVYNALAQQAIAGKAQAIKIFLTHFDDYTERSVSDITAGFAGVTLHLGEDELSPDELAQLHELGGEPQAAPAPEEGLEVGEEPGDAE